MHTIQLTSVQRSISFTPFFQKFFPVASSKIIDASQDASPGDQITTLTAIQSAMSMYVWTIELNGGG